MSIQIYFPLFPKKSRQSKNGSHFNQQYFATLKSHESTRSCKFHEFYLFAPRLQRENELVYVVEGKIEPAIGTIDKFKCGNYTLISNHRPTGIK